MVRRPLILSLSVFVPAAIIAWHTRPQSDVAAPSSHSPPHSLKPLGPSTLHHGDQPTHREARADRPMGPR